MTKITTFFLLPFWKNLKNKIFAIQNEADFAICFFSIYDK